MNSLFDVFDPEDLPPELRHLLSPENQATKIPKPRWEAAAEYGAHLRTEIPIASGTATEQDCHQLHLLEQEWLQKRGVLPEKHKWFTAETPTGVRGSWAYSPEEAAIGITFWWETTITKLYEDTGNRLYDKLRKQAKKDLK